MDSHSSLNPRRFFDLASEQSMFVAKPKELHMVMFEFHFTVKTSSGIFIYHHYLDECSNLMISALCCY